MEKVLGTIQVYQKELRCDNTYAGAMYSGDLIYNVEFMDEEWLSYDTLEWYGANVIDGSSQVLDYDFATKKLKVPYGLYQQDGLIYITLRGVSGDVKYSADLLRLNVGLAVNIEKNNIVEDPSWIDTATEIIEELITSKYDPVSSGLIAEAKKQQEVVKELQSNVQVQQTQIGTAISHLGVYEWNGSRIRFMQGDGSWGEWHDLSGNFATQFELQELRNDAVLDTDIVSDLSTDSDVKPLSAAMGKKLNEEKLSIANIVNLLTSSETNKPLSAAMGKKLNDEKVAVANIVNDLTSGGTNKPLSAQQGKVLNDKIMFAYQQKITVKGATFQFFKYNNLVLCKVYNIGAMAAGTIIEFDDAIPTNLRPKTLFYLNYNGVTGQVSQNQGRYQFGDDGKVVLITNGGVTLEHNGQIIYTLEEVTT